MPNSSEITIIGGGIIGLALAYTFAKAGKQVTVFEKDERAVGASIRNLWYGMANRPAFGHSPQPRLAQSGNMGGSSYGFRAMV